MLLKAIRCQVAPELRSKFSQGQQIWAEAAHVDGFGGQHGGWHNESAWITCWWESWQDYLLFMEKHHDRLFAGSHQEHTIQESKISFWETMDSGQIDRKRSLTLEPGSGILVLELIELSHGTLPDFEDFLKWRWRPALASAPGLSIARMCKHRKMPGRFLSWSHWNKGSDYLGLARMLQPGFRLPNRRLTLLKSLQQFPVPVEATWGIKAETPSSL